MAVFLAKQTRYILKNTHIFASWRLNRTSMTQLSYQKLETWSISWHVTREKVLFLETCPWGLDALFYNNNNNNNNNEDFNSALPPASAGAQCTYKKDTTTDYTTWKQMEKIEKRNIVAYPHTSSVSIALQTPEFDLYTLLVTLTLDLGETFTFHFSR